MLMQVIRQMNDTNMREKQGSEEYRGSGDSCVDSNPIVCCVTLGYLLNLSGPHLLQLQRLTHRVVKCIK